MTSTATLLSRGLLGVFVATVTLWYFLSPYGVRPHPQFQLDMEKFIEKNRPVDDTEGRWVENWTKWKLQLGGEGVPVFILTSKRAFKTSVWVKHYLQTPWFASYGREYAKALDLWRARPNGHKKHWEKKHRFWKIDHQSHNSYPGGPVILPHQRLSIENLVRGALVDRPVLN